MKVRSTPRIHVSALALAFASAAFATTYVAAPTTSHAAVGSAQCQVHAVLASKEGNGEIPKSLAFLQETLRDDQFAAYKGFHLVDRKTLTVSSGEESKASLSPGHRVGILLLGGDAKRLKLRLNLSERDGTGQLVGTDYSIEDHGVLLIQAGPFKSGEIQGKLFFAFQCARGG